MFFKRAKKPDDVPASSIAAGTATTHASTTPANAALSVDKLRRDSDASRLGFKTTADIARTSPAEPFEARRVWDALATALAPHAAKPHRAILITAPSGSGAVRAVAAHLATLPHAVDATAPDWAFLRGDTTAGTWTAVAIPAGQGRRFAAGMEAVLAQLRRTLPYLLASEDLARRRATIQAGYAAIRDDAFARLHAAAHAQNVAVLTTPMGFAVAPMHEGKVVKPEVLARLPQAMRDDVRRKVESVEAELQTLLAEVPTEAGSQVAELSELDADYVRPAIAAGFEGLAKEFSSVAPVIGFLTATQNDIVRRACREGAALALPDYCGRVIEGAGKTAVTLEPPFTADSLGEALLRAGKGAVLIDAGDLDAVPGGWSVLRSALQLRAVVLSDLPAQPLPVTAAVVMIEDDREAAQRRPDGAVASLFPMTAAFAPDAARNDDSESVLARMLAAAADHRGLLPLDAAAVAHLLGEAARATGRPDRLSADLAPLLAIASDAGRIAAQAGRATISAADVQAAQADRHASARVQSLFAPSPAAVAGRVTAVGLGTEPVEVWATVRPGRGTVADIARAAPVADGSASTAVALLWSLLAARCPATQPLSLAAAVVHEPPIAAAAAVRASAAEVCALFSAMAEAPVMANVAVAGWVGPSGALLPLPAINAAIESAFDHLAGRDAAGTLAIVIPRANEAGLMLRGDVAEAARKGRLQIFTAGYVNQALAIVTGLPVASDDPTEPGLARRIDDRLAAFARQFAASEVAVRVAGKSAAS